MVFVSACGGDSSAGPGSDLVDSGGNAGNEQTGPVRFSTEVLNIFNASCGGSGCHINAVKNGVNLTTYSTVMSSRGTKYNSLIVLAGNAAGSPLINKLGSNPAFGVRMPDGKPALSSTQIATISRWINEGALNN